MGLRQDFRFDYNSIGDVEEFLRSFSDTYSVQERNGFFIISGAEGKDFTFDASIQSHGLRSERAGQYFEFLGIIVERLTGEFGCVGIEDV